MANPNESIGMGNTLLDEPENKPVYNNTNGEKVLRGENNTFIVFGRDRPAEETSGYGGGKKGDGRNCGAIDIVVGRLSALNTLTLQPKDKATKSAEQLVKSINQRFPVLQPNLVNSNVGGDAARIYISQKADIDEYYGLVEGKTQAQVKGVSAIAIKADDIRIMSRNTFKIVTKPDAFLSTGKDVPAYAQVGVQLIANNDDSNMQPMVRGTNLVKAFISMSDKIEQLSGLVAGFIQLQNGFNSQLMVHDHKSPFYAASTSIDPNTLNEGTKFLLECFFKEETGLRNFRNNMIAWKHAYINPASKLYINSKYHYLN
jgi:hypothetical protein